MVSSLSDPSQKSVLAQLQALLGVCQSRLVHGIKNMDAGNSNVNVNSNSNKSGTTTNWEWQLQESGIFEEDSQHQSAATVDGSTQTESDQQLTRSVSPSQAVQAVAEMCDFAIQVDPPQDRPETRDEAVQVCELQSDSVSSQPVVTVSNNDCQTEEPIMSMKDFRDIESYYEQQVEILQKEKATHRKKFQLSRDETAQLTAQLEQLSRQFQERERQFEEILQKNCRAFERELETARNINTTELNTLKECLQLVWLELKDYSAHNNLPEMPKTSVMEFTQALISTLHGICSELGQLRTRVQDLAEMEQAFQMTLQQADGLVHHIEEKHLQRIRELEQTEQDLRSQLMMGQPEVDSGGEQTRPTTDFDGSLEIKIQGTLCKPINNNNICSFLQKKICIII
jgi:predicted  nucleic acid-binding Zn-ribbon protein